MKAIHSFGHLFGGILLVAATTIGVGMLALPIATSSSGFVPAVFTYVFCWAFMLCTAFLMIELSLWLPSDSSFVSISEKTLGPIGRNLILIVYLFLFLTVMVAHIVGGVPILQDLTNLPLPTWLFAILYPCCLAPIIYFGTKWVDRINIVLFSGVALSYLSFFLTSFDRVDTQLLKFSDWSKIWVGFPVLFTAFTFQVIIPTLVNYLKRDARKIRIVVVIGSLIPLIVYLLWEFLILGIVPHEQLLEAGRLGQNSVTPLRNVIGTSNVYLIGKYFAFFTLTTSFIPFSLSFFDFLADGLKVKKKGINKVFLLLAVFGVPLVIALIYPNIFLVALGYAGGFSCALLFGFFPPLMVWVGRYLKKTPPEYRMLPGGKSFLAFLMIFSLFILGIEMFQQFGF
jgi:tyrosine-specific transport protein